MVSLGSIGGAITPQHPAALDAAVEAEELGYGTVWLPGDLTLVSDVVRATSRITVTTGIASVDQVPAAAVASAYTALAGRFVPGLGGAHGAKPLATLNAYLDELDPVVPASDRVLSALGPRMLELARDRAAGAYPYLVTPDYLASARSIVGPDTRLAVLLTVVPEVDPGKAREIVRGGPLRFLSGMPGYAANFRRMGFTDSEIAELSDRLVDSLTVWGDLDTVVRRLTEYRDAGADHLVVQMGGLPDEWRAQLPKVFG